MTRLKVTEAPRELERPHKVDAALETVTPQFFLRNTYRAERFADHEDLLELGYAVYRDLEFREYLEDARLCRFDRRDRGIEFARNKLRLLVAERRAVMVDTAWHEIFGRPDPQHAEPT